MQCKKALCAEGIEYDIEKATLWLRKNGSAKAVSKVSGRDASEGMIGICLNECRASMVKVSSETDFSSRSSSFLDLVELAGSAALSGSASGTLDTKSLLTAKTGDSGYTLKDEIDRTILAIRENVFIREACVVSSGDDTVLSTYVHGKVSENTGTSAAIVRVGRTNSSPEATKERMEEVGRKLAMHIVAAGPIYLSPSVVPDDVINKEKEILINQMQDSGKPANIIEKIVEGRIRKFYESICLTEQVHMVEEGQPKVSKFLGELGIEIQTFERYSIQ